MTAESLRGTEGEAQRSVRIPWSARAVQHVRRSLVEDLQGSRVSADVVDEAEIVVSELVGNAIRHARPLPDGTVRVRWKIRGGTVEVEVADGGGPSTPRPAPPALWSTSGRGLRIVRSLAHEWGVTESKHGRTVWACLGGPSRRRSH